MQIEADFDVWKALTGLRESESMTLNDVLRKLLKLPPAAAQAGVAPKAGCVFKGVEFPEGTQFRANYKGKVYTGEIKNGAWIDEHGAEHSSPSAAAYAIVQSGINGWWFWACKRPGDADWTQIGHIRNALAKAA